MENADDVQEISVETFVAELTPTNITIEDPQQFYVEACIFIDCAEVLFRILAAVPHS